ncbi:DUF1294 domain-containing protein [Pseudomonas benzenivorans]|uniref:DUF1294 domain-containing protein n=1 Tax=Pseudomonas benzenivorans TaxID=556533 RepID=A0ABY5H4I8_9PSED|nr:DUF1294 domain-containing protein [Pseudomonas benzenivorans]
MRLLPMGAGALWLLSARVQGQGTVHRCLQPDGVVLYSDQACSMAHSNLALSVSGYASYPPMLRGLAKLWHEQLQPLFGGIEVLPYLALLYGLMSLVCFVAYYRDKQFAMRGARRTPEARLHLYELFGGWPGGLLAQRMIRHKNRKLGYQVRFWLIVLSHLLVAAAVLWLAYWPESRLALL